MCLPSWGGLLRRRTEESQGEPEGRGERLAGAGRQARTLNDWGTFSGL